jgi:hypothetical protein
MTSAFRWTKASGNAALALADGQTQAQAAEAADVTDRTIRSWLKDPDFAAEVDRLTLMMGIASRAERLRIAKRVAKQRVKDDYVETEKDLLDWLKFAQSETDGIKLDLAALAALQASLAGEGPDRGARDASGGDATAPPGARGEA